MLSKRKNNFNNLSEEYLKDKSEVTFYNLPKKVEFCKTCTMSNQKPIHMIPESIMEQSSLMVNQHGNIKLAITILSEMQIKIVLPSHLYPYCFANVQ